MACTAGLAVIVAFFVIIVYQTSVTGFPAIRNGELPLWKVKVRQNPDLRTFRSIQPLSLVVSGMQRIFASLGRILPCE